MSVGDEPVECPLCMEPLEIDDINFFPCTCGYQICRFCWHRIRTDENGLCPACRKQYPEDPAEFKPLTDDELQNIKRERKQKECQRKQKAAENRKHLANVRVVQKNLVFVVGLSQRLADPEVLKKHDYFGRFGKIHKVVINQSTSYAGSQGPSASAYVTYVRPEDALKAILAVNNVHVDGRTLKTSLGTTKYCSHFLRGSQCMKADCMYLHELGEEAASFTKEEMQMGKHQEYEQKLIEQFLDSQNSVNNHLSNNKIQSRKKSGSPTSQQQINQHSPPIAETVLQANSKLSQPGLSQGGDSLQAASASDAWPSLQPLAGAMSGAGVKADGVMGGSNSSSRTNTPPENTSSLKAVGNRHHRIADSQNCQDKGDSDAESASESPVGHLQGLPNSESHLLNNNIGPPLSGGLVSTQHASLYSPTETPSPPSQSPHSPDPTHLPLPLSSSQPVSVMPIGANRRLPGFHSAANSLSFFSNNILGSKVVPPPLPSHTERTESMLPAEMEDSIPVSSSTDWSAAFGFKNKEPPDDDLGFDPCTESCKGLADLIEKENGANWSQSQAQMCSVGHEQFSFATHVPQQLQGSVPGPSQHSLPPGFSLNHIQQQQLHQQLFRPADIGSSQMIDFQQYRPRPRFPVMLNNFRHGGPDMGSHIHHAVSQAAPLPRSPPQPDVFTMKDMQDQLRSLLPNINISFGSPPHLSTSQPPPPPPGVSPPQPAGGRLAPDTPWLQTDPAILCSRPVEDTPHWLKSIHQLTESDGPMQSHSCFPSFMQHFPLGPASGWPPQTQNPPPGFRTPIRTAAAAPEPQKMAEALQ